jgi:hypothetical protein
MYPKEIREFSGFSWRILNREGEPPGEPYYHVYYYCLRNIAFPRRFREEAHREVRPPRHGKPNVILLNIYRYG